ncbi:MAG: LamG-like jellyroll fold domain-containing protein, partial [Kiritimatiellia bacterium]
AYLIVLLLIPLITTAQTLVVRAGFDATALSALESQTGTPTIDFSNIGASLVTKNQKVGSGCFESYGGKNWARISGIKGITAREGFTIGFWFKPRSRAPWHTIFGFRLGTHNFRLENCKEGGDPSLTLFADKGLPTRVNLCGWHPANKLPLEAWYAIVLTYYDGIFKLYRDGQLIDTYTEIPTIRPADGLEEIIIGRGRDDAAANAAWKNGLYAQFDDFVLWSGVVAPSALWPQAAKDGTAMLAPLRGALPGGTYALTGGTLTLRPCQAKNPNKMTLIGYGRVELFCKISDLELALDATQFRGDILLKDGGSGANRKLSSRNLQLGASARLVIEQGMQLLVIGTMNVPSIALSGAGEKNGEEFGALRLIEFPLGAVCSADLELMGDTTIAAAGTLKGTVTHRLSRTPTLTLGSQNLNAWHFDHLSDMNVQASLGTADRPLALTLNCRSMTLSKDSFLTTVKLETPTHLISGTHQAQTIQMNASAILYVKGSAILGAETIVNASPLMIEKGGTLLTGTNVSGALSLLAESKIKMVGNKALTAGFLSLQENGKIMILGSPEQLTNERLPLLQWQAAVPQPKVSDFQLSPALAGATLSVSNNTLWINGSYSMATKGCKICIVDGNGAPSPEALPEAGAFILAHTPNAPKQGIVTLKVIGETSDDTALSSAQAANIAYLLNIAPVTHVQGNEVQASFAYHFGIREVRRQSQEMVSLIVTVEPFDSMGTLGSSLNGYIQVLGKTDAKDRQWAVLGEAVPGTDYAKGTLEIRDIRTVRKGKTYRLFGLRLSPLSYKK